MQHRSPLVRQVTLSLLCEQLKAAEDVLSALEAAGAQDPRGPSAWEALATRLRGMLRCCFDVLFGIILWFGL